MFEVTNRITLRGYSSAHIKEGDEMYCYPFSVDKMEHISHSFYVYPDSSTMTAGASRTETRFYNSSGKRISTKSHSWSITTPGTFNAVKIEAIPLPSSAAYAVVVFKAPTGSGGYYIAMPKSEEGKIVTPYSANYKGNMTYLTPMGIYTGTITARQVILSSENDLDHELTTLNSTVIGVSKGLDKQNQTLTLIKAGDITLSQSTKGILAGLNIRPDSLTYSSSGSYFSIQAKSGEDFIRAGTSPTNNVFRVKSDGTLVATGAEITGRINANSGSIGGWDITSSAIRRSDSSAGIGTGDKSNIFWGGYSGRSYKFRVDKDGKLYAQDAEISGKIKASEGSIGGWIFTSTALKSRDGRHGIGLSPDSSSILWAGYNGSSTMFRVDNSGKLYARDAVISGTLTAGTIINNAQVNNSSFSGGSFSGGTFKGTGDFSKMFMLDQDGVRREMKLKVEGSGGGGGGTVYWEVM